jgi:hypothetical protein
MRSRDEMGHRFNEVRAGVEPGLEVDLGEPVVGYNAVENAPEHRAERKPGVAGSRRTGSRERTEGR